MGREGSELDVLMKSCIPVYYLVFWRKIKIIRLVLWLWIEM